MKAFSLNARNLMIALGQYGDGWISGDNVLLNTVPVSEVARYMGWGWHRTNNALKELGYR